MTKIPPKHSYTLMTPVLLTFVAFGHEINKKDAGISENRQSWRWIRQPSTSSGKEADVDARKIVPWVEK